MIVAILLLGVFVCKKNQQKVLLLGWSFSAGVMYMALFLALDLLSGTTLVQKDINIFIAIALALTVSFFGMFLTMIDN